MDPEARLTLERRRQELEDRRLAEQLASATPSPAKRRRSLDSTERRDAALAERMQREEELGEALEEEENQRLARSLLEEESERLARRMQAEMEAEAEEERSARRRRFEDDAQEDHQLPWRMLLDEELASLGSRSNRRRGRSHRRGPRSFPPPQPPYPFFAPNDPFAGLQVAHGGPDLSYEAMLALDEQVTKPRRVAALERIGSVFVWQPEQEADDCCICMSKFEAGDRAVMIQCGHKYHRDELDQWLESGSVECPICKFDLTTV